MEIQVGTHFFVSESSYMNLSYYEKQEKVKVLANTISKKLGLNRLLSEYEYAYVEKWNVVYFQGKR